RSGEGGHAMAGRSTVCRRFTLWFVIAAGCIAPAIRAATPPGGTVSETTPTVTWIGPLMVPTLGSCGEPDNAACDNFKLTIAPPSSSFGPYIVKITLQPENGGDWDLEVYGPDAAYVNGSGNSAGVLETVVLFNPAGGTYTIVGIP